MSRYMLRASAIRKGWLYLSLVGAVIMHRPIVQGATVLSDPQQPGTTSQITFTPTQVGIVIRNTAFSTGNAVEEIATSSDLLGGLNRGLINTSPTPSTAARKVPTSMADASQLTPSGDNHWFAFERRWLSLQAETSDDAHHAAHTVIGPLPRTKPAIKSNPIPLPLAVRSGLAFGVVIGIWALSRRGQRAFR